MEKKDYIVLEGTILKENQEQISEPEMQALIDDIVDLLESKGYGIWSAFKLANDSDLEEEIKSNAKASQSQSQNQ